MPRESPREGADEVPGWWWQKRAKRKGASRLLFHKLALSSPVWDMSCTLTLDPSCSQLRREHRLRAGALRGGACHEKVRGRVQTKSRAGHEAEKGQAEGCVKTPFPQACPLLSRVGHVLHIDRGGACHEKVRGRVQTKSRAGGGRYHCGPGAVQLWAATLRSGDQEAHGCSVFSLLSLSVPSLLPCSPFFSQANATFD
jgi:hypothetical protein